MTINYLSFIHVIVGHCVKNHRVKLGLDYFCLTQSLESRVWAQPCSGVHCVFLALNLHDAVVVSLVSVSLHVCGVQGTLWLLKSCVAQDQEIISFLGRCVCEWSTLLIEAAHCFPWRTTSARTTAYCLALPRFLVTISFWLCLKHCLSNLPVFLMLCMWGRVNESLFARLGCFCFVLHTDDERCRHAGNVMVLWPKEVS